MGVRVPPGVPFNPLGDGFCQALLKPDTWFNSRREDQNIFDISVENNRRQAHISMRKDTTMLTAILATRYRPLDKQETSKLFEDLLNKLDQIPSLRKAEKTAV